MNIELPSELERAAEAVAIAHGFPDVAAYVVDVLKRELETAEHDTKPKNWQNTPEWREEFRAWATSRPKLSHAVEMDCDSIYGPRGR